MGVGDVLEAALAQLDLHHAQRVPPQRLCQPSVLGVGKGPAQEDQVRLSKALKPHLPDALLDRAEDLLRLEADRGEGPRDGRGVCGVEGRHGALHQRLGNHGKQLGGAVPHLSKRTRERRHLLRVVPRHRPLHDVLLHHREEPRRARPPDSHGPQQRRHLLGLERTHAEGACVLRQPQEQALRAVAAVREAQGGHGPREVGQRLRDHAGQRAHLSVSHHPHQRLLPALAPPGRHGVRPHEVREVVPVEERETAALHLHADGAEHQVDLEAELGDGPRDRRQLPRIELVSVLRQPLIDQVQQRPEPRVPQQVGLEPAAAGRDAVDAGREIRAIDRDAPLTGPL
mmetsp:Transcript_34661/g.67945  ORF Transcript_34661/g.67945 Transcript_34661/m.67945 type:complete len:342 (-) Transcript_34661:101-1126(-)